MKHSTIVLASLCLTVLSDSARTQDLPAPLEWIGAATSVAAQARKRLGEPLVQNLDKHGFSQKLSGEVSSADEVHLLREGKASLCVLPLTFHVLDLSTTSKPAGESRVFCGSLRCENCVGTVAEPDLGPPFETAIVLAIDDGIPDDVTDPTTRSGGVFAGSRLHLASDEESVFAQPAGLRDYFGIRDPWKSMHVGNAGLRVGHGSQGNNGRRTLDLYPSQGFYLGGSFGITDGNESSSKLAGDINSRQAGRNVSVTLDDTDAGAKVFLGYRFDSPFAIELGYADLGGYVSSINTAVIDPTLIGDVLDIHPVTGRGISISFVGTPIEYGRFSAFGKVGAWYWESDLDVTVGNQSVKSSFDGIDFQAGVGMQYRFSPSLFLRAEYERYFLDQHHVDMISLGVVYKF